MVKMLTAWWQDRRNRTTVSAIVWFLLLFYSIVHVGYSAIRYFGESDFDVMLRYAKTFAETGVYPDYGRYTYPPLYFLLMRPLIHLDPMAVRVGAYLLFAGLLVWTVVIATRLYAGDRVGWCRWLVIGVLCANFQPFLEALSAHSIESVEVWLVALALAAFLRGRKRWCGALIMVAANLKFFPGVFLLYFLYKQQWRVMQGAFAALAGIALAIVLAFGPSVAVSHYLGTPVRMLGFETSNLGEQWSGLWATDNMLNLSLRGAVNRFYTDQQAALASGWGYYSIRHPVAAHWTALGLQALVLAGLGYLLRRPIATPRQLHLESLLVLISIFLLAPASVSYYAIFLLPAVVWLGLALTDRERLGLAPVALGFWMGWYLLVGNFLPLGLLHYLPRVSPYMHNVYWYWWHSWPLIGELMLAAGVGLALAAERRRSWAGDEGADDEARITSHGGYGMSRVTEVTTSQCGAIGTVIFVVPAYNEETNIGTLLDGTSAQMPRWRLAYRMIIVDDGSTDRTAAIVEQYARTMPIELVRHPGNRGVGAVFRTGIERALAVAEPHDVIVFKEADNTSDPMVLRQMLVLIEQGGEVVLASCYAKGGGVVGTTVARRILSAGANSLLRLIVPVPGIKTYSSFYRAIRAATLRAAVAAYNGRLIEEGGFTCAAEMVIKLARVGAVIREVPMVLRCDATKTPSKQKRLRTILGYLRLFAREGVWRRWDGRAVRRRYVEAVRGNGGMPTLQPAQPNVGASG